ncbi:Uncharacterized protein SCF082_LOCUS39285 [Durusdinium trenchii]|uniref:Uncharacterized protein n=1 Tax=Durusdinium trenchii TaxID=1381693 RepID=A0ABP0Q338_9DINO
MLQLETSVSGTNTHLKKGQARNLTNCGHLIQETCDPDANAFCSNNCKVHTHGQDCYRPVPDVMAEHPGEDGYCYFNQTGFWVSPLPVPPNFETSSIQGILGLRGADYHGKDQGPLITFHFEGQVLTTYMDLPHYSYDDLYGYSLGYLQNQGLDAVMMKNSSFWIERSKQKCLEIQETYHFQNESGPKHVNQATRNSKIARLGLGFIFINHLGREIFRRHEELVLADWLDDNIVLATKVLCSSLQDCEPITAKDFAKHHYIKCLLGYPNSASDGAYLNSRACLLEGNHIGHFTDCPYSPPVSF